MAQVKGEEQTKPSSSVDSNEAFYRKFLDHLVLHQFELATTLLKEGCALDFNHIEDPSVREKLIYEFVSPLHYAIAYGNQQAMEWLIEKGANINQTDKEGSTPLILATAQGTRELVTYLLHHGANIFSTSKKGKNMLHIAAEFNNIEAIKILFLLQHTIDINTADKEGNTALHVAVTQGHMKVLELLFQKSADANIPNQNGDNPIHIAVKSNSTNMLNIVQLLLQNYALPYKLDAMGILPLAYTTHSICRLLLQTAMSKYSRDFKYFDQTLCKSGLSIGQQYHLLVLYHHYELLLCLHQAHILRFDYSAAVISNDLESIEKCANRISNLHNANYLFYISSTSNTNTAALLRRNTIIELLQHLLDDITIDFNREAINSMTNVMGMERVKSLTRVLSTVSKMMELEGGIDRDQLNAIVEDQGEKKEGDEKEVNIRLKGKDSNVVVVQENESISSSSSTARKRGIDTLYVSGPSNLQNI